MNNALIILAPRDICVKKSKEYELGIYTEYMCEENCIGYAAYSHVLDRRVSLNYTGMGYTYQERDFAEYENPTYMIWSPIKHDFDWVKNPQYFNA